LKKINSKRTTHTRTRLHTHYDYKEGENLNEKYKRKVMYKYLHKRTDIRFRACVNARTQTYINMLTHKVGPVATTK
jgi:hypothetical protein